MASYQIVHDLLVGFPAADTGVAYFYSPGTTTPIVIYGDSSGTAQTNPVTLDSNGAARVYLSQLARMIVQDANGATVWDGTINAQQDATVATTSTAFSAATLKAALDTALTKFGGQDFQYVPSGSWVGMSPKAWMNGVVRNVMAYGSVGATSINDGVTPADAAIAAAIADAQANGASDVFLPPGTYLLNSPVAINTTGVTIRGAGAGVTTIKINSATNNGFVVTSASGVRFRGLTIIAATATTGAAITTNSGGMTLDDVTTTTSVDKALVMTGSSNVTVQGNCSLAGATYAVSATTVSQLTIVGGVYNGGTASIITSGCTGVAVIGANAFLMTFDAASSGVAVVGCTGSLVFSGAQPTGFFQRGNGIDGSTITVATGATATAIDLSLGHEFLINASSGGAGTVTVPDPTKLPSSTTRNYFLTVKYRNAAGGAVTWAFSGTKFVHVGAAVPANTALHTITVLYLWDGTVFREISRGDTLT